MTAFESLPKIQPRLYPKQLIEVNQVCNPFRHRRDLPSYREQMLGSAEYHRLGAVAKKIDCERREHEENTLQ